MWRFLLGGVIGYLLGSRAAVGPTSDSPTYRRVVDQPATQGGAGIASATITDWCDRPPTSNRPSDTQPTCATAKIRRNGNQVTPSAPAG